MASVDDRIEREAMLFEQEIDGVESRRNERLRTLLYDEVRNMRSRSLAQGVKKDGVATWLHMKTYEATYQDYAIDSKEVRTRHRIRVLLRLCRGDKKLLLQKYAEMLTLHFPIADPRYRWAPRLVRLKNGHVTVVHRWARNS